MALKPRRKNKMHTKVLTKKQKAWFHWGLALGPKPEESGFESMDDAKEQWKVHGEQIVKEWAEGSPGRRPIAYWWWTLDEDPEDPREAVKHLIDNNLLFDFERSRAQRSLDLYDGKI